MAVKKKVAKRRMTTKNFMNDDTAEKEVQASVEEETPAVEEVPEVEVASVDGESDAAPAKNLPVAGKKSAKNPTKYEIVVITVFQDIDPAPTIGNYDFSREKGITSVAKGKHEVPRFVAELLVEKGLATM
jgi:hypothetical protein